MVHISQVIPRENYRLEVTLENGSSLTVSLESKLGTVRFGMLADQEFFRQVSTDGNCIAWGKGIEISLNEVFQLARQ